jgi:hypothetical protein
MVAEDLPALFWSGSMPGDDYNPENMLNGLSKATETTNTH